MACLLKLPLGQSKGVVTFTTPEQRVMNSKPHLRGMLNELRKQYVTGLHFNWHDYQFKPDPLFDFFMAGEKDLRPVNNTPYRLFPLDACNFTPSIYTPNGTAKFWDLLIVGNPVFFKRPEVVLKTIRKLFDKTGRRYRILYICPIPEYKLTNLDTAFYDIREYYEALFTREERNWFTLLTTTFNSPFPFDRHTLSVFFQNSRVFLHCTTDERRCRIAAYAWCAGLPVVAYPSVASILPESLQCEPGFFRVDNDDDYVTQIVAALDAADHFDSKPYRMELSETYMTANLDNKLEALFGELELPYQGKLLDRNLDIRLGWHHGIGGKINGVGQPLDEFMPMLQSIMEHPPGFIDQLIISEYPERLIVGENGEDRREDIAEIEKRFIYLNPKKKRWLRVYCGIKSRLGFN